MSLKNKIKDKLLGKSHARRAVDDRQIPNNITPEDRIKIAKDDLREARLKLKTAKVRLRNKKVEKKLTMVRK